MSSRGKVRVLLLDGNSGQSRIAKAEVIPGKVGLLPPYAWRLGPGLRGNQGVLFFVRTDVTEGLFSGEAAVDGFDSNKRDHLAILSVVDGEDERQKWPLLSLIITAAAGAACLVIVGVEAVGRYI